MLAKKESLSSNIILSSSSTKYIAGFIDSILRAKRDNFQYDYSEALAKIFAAKSCYDEHCIHHAIYSEILFAIENQSVVIGECEFISVNDLLETLDHILDPAVEQLEEKIDELESEMNWTEVSKFKSLCGE